MSTSKTQEEKKNKSMTEPGFFVSEPGVIDMQFHRLRRAINQAKTPLELITLAELSMRYVNEEIMISMQAGQMKYHLPESQPLIPVNVDNDSPSAPLSAA